MSLTGGHCPYQYFDRAGSYLKYATNASGAWVATAVDTGGNVGEFNSIAVK